MKIIHLRFKNLNSLAGEWEIDFRHPEFVSSGIFAITGPTGAGKTTILDAICLALYGQTPRLSRITQSENEIMSRQSGECFAEVEFETAKGLFRCHWSQHRSRKQADGQLQSPRHEIAEAASGMILESKLKTVAGKVEEVTGMDFERFTRSMLLAQGGFAAFLQARPDERAPILEQITGTAIYSRISIKVHERTSEERKRLMDMRGELNGIQLLLPAEIDALLAEKAELQRSESGLVANTQVIREAQAWLERIAALEAEIRQMEQARNDFQIRKDAAEPDLARLALAGRAIKLSGDHASLLSVRAQQQGEQGILAAATQRLPQLQADWQTAFDMLKQYESQLALAGSAQAEGAELIRITREFDIKLGEARTQLQALVSEIEKTGRQNGDYRLKITDSLQRLANTEVALQAVSTFLAEHQADAGLVEALTGIEQQLKSVKILDRQRRETTEKFERQVAMLNSAKQQLDLTELAWQDAQRSVAKSEQSVAELQVVRADLLQGRDLTECRTAAEELADRQSRLVTVSEALVRVADVTKKLAELNSRLQELEQRRKMFLEKDQTLTAECELRDQIAARLRENVALLGRIRSLEEQRKQLVDGAPCPLCGSDEHPYAAGNIPQLDDAERELELAVAAAKTVREQLSGIKLEQVALDKDLQQASLDQAEMHLRQSGDAALCTGAVAELGMVIKPDVMVDAHAWLEHIGQELATCRLELANERGVIVAAEQQEQQERAAQVSLSKLKDALAELDKVRLTERMWQENGLVERQRLESESSNFNNELERMLAEVAYVVAVYGCLEVVPDSVDELLAGLIIRRNAYAQHLLNREQLEKERADIAAEADKQRALLSESEKTCVEKEQQLRDRTSQRDTLLKQRQEMYGERNPDVEEKLLADTLRQAGERREGALRELHRLQNELGGVKGEVERLTLSVTQRTVQLSELEAAFLLRLDEAGFVDESVFLQACLPQLRFEELTDMADKLRQVETALQTRLQDRAETLSGELAKDLTNKPLELIKDEHTAISEQLSQLQKTLGGIEQRLHQHSEQQQRHKSRLQAFDMQKLECERWDRLHSLIGSGDGKKFRNFAQGLTFELMVTHANRQLQKMSDRYILVRDGSEPLELNVIDNYQAGEIRSTKNLSGGESFIASLALSLGLSSMASRNVRVDSLFLDEGFGTLDEDALETALETLSGLQQEGKLIGIISHVPALKERIGIQIQVEAGSSGRSRLSGPGCRQV